MHASCGCSGAWHDISRARRVVSGALRNVSHARCDGSRALRNFSSVLRDISCVQRDVSRVLHDVTCALCRVSRVLRDFSWVPECRWVEHYRTKKMQDRLRTREMTLDTRVFEGSVTAPIIQEFICEQFAYWGVRRRSVQPVFMTTDRGSNIASAVIGSCDMVWVVCLAHVLHWAIAHVF